MCGVSYKLKHFSEVLTLSVNDQAMEQETKEKLIAQVSVCMCDYYVCICVCVRVFMHKPTLGTLCSENHTL